MGILDLKKIDQSLERYNHYLFYELIKIKKLLNHKNFHVRLILACLLIVAVTSSLLFNKTAHGQTIYLSGINAFSFPATDQNFAGQSIPDDCSADSSEMLNDFFTNYVPQNTTVVLPSYGCYQLDDIPSTSTAATGSVVLNGLVGVTIIGNGTTFERINPDQKNVPMFTLINNDNLSIQNLTINGGYNGSTYGGVAYEESYGLLLQGNRNLNLNGLNVNNIQGDGINLWFNNGYQLSPQLSLNANILVVNSNFNNIGYHGITLEGVNGATFENNSFTNVSVDGIDAEYDDYSTQFPVYSGSVSYKYPYPAAEDNVSIINNSWNGTGFLFYVSVQGQSPGVQEQNVVLSGNNIEKNTPLLYINGSAPNGLSVGEQYLNDGLFFQDNYMSNGAVAKGISGGSIINPDTDSVAALRKISDVNIDNNVLPVYNGNENYFPDTSFLSVFTAYGLGDSIQSINNPANYYDATNNPYAPNNSSLVGFNLLDNNFSGAIQIYNQIPSDWIQINNPNQTKTSNSPAYANSAQFPSSFQSYQSYNSSTLYRQGDIVGYSGNLYVYIDPNTYSGNAPGALDSSYYNNPYWQEVQLSVGNSLFNPYQYSQASTSQSFEPTCQPNPTDPTAQFNQGDVIEVICSYTNTSVMPPQQNQSIYFYFVYTNSNPSNSSAELSSLKNSLQSLQWKNLSAPVNITNQCNNTFLYGIQDFSNGTNGPSNAGNNCSNPTQNATCSVPISQTINGNPVLPSNYQVGNPGQCYYPTPASPSGVKAQFNGNHSITISWDSVSPSNTGQSIAGYYLLKSSIQPSVVNTQPNTSIVLTGDNSSPISCSTSCSYTDTNVSAGVSYYYGVEAVDSGGINYLSNDANNSNAPCPTSANAATTLTTTNAGSCIPPSVSTPSFITQAVTDTDSSTSYPIISFTPDTPNAQLINPSQVSITWTQNSSFSTSNIGGYYIYRSTSSTNNINLANIGNIVGSIPESSCSGVKCSFIDSTIQSNTSSSTFYYYIVAYDNNTPSNLSNPSPSMPNPQSQVTVYTPPSNPDGLVFSNVGSNSATLTWNPSSTSTNGVPDGYNILQSLPSNTFENPGLWNPNANYVQGNLVNYNGDYYVDINSNNITGNSTFCSSPLTTTSCPNNSSSWQEITKPTDAADWTNPATYSSSSSYSQGNLVVNNVNSVATYYICVSVNGCPSNSLSSVSTSTLTGDWVQDVNKSARTRNTTDGSVNNYRATATYLLGQALKNPTSNLYYYCINIAGCPKASPLPISPSTSNSNFLQVSLPSIGTFTSPAIYDSSGATTYTKGNLINDQGNYYIYVNNSGYTSSDPTPQLDNNQSYFLLVTNNPYSYSSTPTIWTSNSTYQAGDIVSQNGNSYVYISPSSYSPSAFTTLVEPSNDETDWLETTSASTIWNSLSTYSKGNVVSYLDYYYISLNDSNTDKQPTPGSSDSYWQVVSSQNIFVSKSSAGCSDTSSKTCTYNFTNLEPGYTYSVSLNAVQYESPGSSAIPLISTNSTTKSVTTSSSLTCIGPNTPTGLGLQPVANSFESPGIYSSTTLYTFGNYIESSASSGNYFVYIGNATSSGIAITNTTDWLPVTSDSATSALAYNSSNSYLAGDIVNINGSSNYYVALYNVPANSVNPINDVSGTYWLALTDSIGSNSVVLQWNNMSPSTQTNTACNPLAAISSYSLYYNNGIFAYVNPNSSVSSSDADFSDTSTWYPIATQGTGSLSAPFSYISTHTYSQGDIVLESGTYYLEYTTTTSKGTDPSSDSTKQHWTVLSTNTSSSSTPFNSNNSNITNWQTNNTYNLGDLVNSGGSCDFINESTGVTNQSNSTPLLRNFPSINSSGYLFHKASGLLPQTTYNLCLSDTDSNNPSLNSSPTSLTIRTDNFLAPSTPTHFTAAPSNTDPAHSIVLNWGASTVNNKYSDGLGGYLVFVNGVVQPLVAAGTNTLTLTGLTSVTNYSFTIQAVDISQQYFSSQSKAISLATTSSDGGCTITNPTAPTLNPVVFTNNSATISWTASTQACGPGISEYTIYETQTDSTTNATTNYTYTVDGSGNSNTFTYTDNSTISPGNSYSYYVVASDSSSPANVSPDSSPVSFTISPPYSLPSSPTNLSITSTTQNEIDLSWSPATAGSNPIAGYNIYENNNSSPIASVSGDTTTFNATGLNPNTSYSFSVTAVDSLGNESTQTSISGNTLNIPTPAVTITAPVSSQSILNVSSVTVNASETGGSIANVKLYVNRSNNAQIIATQTTPTTGSTYSFNWKTVPQSSSDSTYPNGAYTLTAVATDASGISTTSTPVTVYVDNGDVDSDQCVTLHDFAVLATHYNQSVASMTNGDLDGNGIVQLHDFSILASNYGYKEPGSSCSGN